MSLIVTILLLHNSTTCKNGSSRAFYDRRISMRTLVATLLAALTAMPIISQAPTDLPIRRIMLYKHGVGYFERSGSTASGAEIVLEFKASEMNDVLKSLTLLDRSGGRVSGVSYESSDPIQKQLENFGLTVPPDAGLAEVLAQFKGARVVVRTQSTPEIAGAILGARRVALEKTEQQVLTLLLDNGEIRGVPLTEATSLKLEDPKRQRDLANRSEERRVGKECRSRWSPYH